MAQGFFFFFIIRLMFDSLPCFVVTLWTTCKFCNIVSIVSRFIGNQLQLRSKQTSVSAELKYIGLNVMIS